MQDLYGQAQGLVEQWSDQIQKESQTLFENGQLDQAIATLQSIPEKAPAAPSVKLTVEKWQKSWNEGEAALKSSQDLLARGQWLAAKNQLEKIAPTPYWNQKKKPLLQEAEAGIAGSGTLRSRTGSPGGDRRRCRPEPALSQRQPALV
ncbi:MAG: hypothetical protein HC824_01810 [Synechococcales cyanobacterium RM1_1_8]|nr:hypothetical protein [Synechococcales cyanobacterium RM1_1_8]